MGVPIPEASTSGTNIIQSELYMSKTAIPNPHCTYNKERDLKQLS